MKPGQSVGRGRMITLEGIEGVGKSTHLAFVAEWIRAAGRKVCVTREPGGVPVAEGIRGLLLAPTGPRPPPLSELLLMFAARAAHLQELVWPALDAGEWVVCDRFTDASYAYQAAGRGLPESSVAALEGLVQGEFRPDLTILLDASWEATLRRREQRGTTDRFEAEDHRFFDRVREGYLKRARMEPTRVRVVDASGSLESVRSLISPLLEDLLARSGAADG